MKRYAVVVMAMMLALLPIRSYAEGAPEEAHVEGLVQEAIVVLSDSSLTEQQRHAGLRPLFGKYMDLPFIGRFVLGRYWRPLDDARKKRYTAAFEAYVENVYAKRVNSYSGETIKVTGARNINDLDTLVTTSLLRPSGPPVAVAWRVRLKNDQTKIIDVVVEGVSMVISQREEFASYLQRNSIDDLIKRLENQSGSSG